VMVQSGALEAVQLKVVLVEPVPDAFRFVGALGSAEHAAHEPCDVHGCPLPAGPLLVAGF